MLRGLVLSVALGVAVCGVAAAGGTDLLDAEGGFRDARFGATFESFAGLQLLTDSGAYGSTLYTRPAEDLRFGDASLDGVTYGFYAGRLYFVTLFTSGERNGRAALAELERAYGPGARSAGDAAEYVWRGQQVLLHYRLDPVTSMGMVAATSLPMDARVLSDRAANFPAKAE
jgi:hypothetical protein